MALEDILVRLFSYGLAAGAIILVGYILRVFVRQIFKDTYETYLKYVKVVFSTLAILVLLHGSYVALSYRVVHTSPEATDTKVYPDRKPIERATKIPPSDRSKDQDREREFRKKLEKLEKESLK